ncbi:dihydrofolate reductase family protein [Nocardioides bruguierae]|uniref:dihydrofolate reductase family protein n=1 Tax=Nocardioides bruguierae TaxID=2945102 RepID=UPI002020C03C|nr:dihydrofolate reductase family protein [Nocardioides bruguierae]MCL8023895.1 dihydrofolate reductase family protein [Nocardioides bruguierae]
MIPGSSPEQKEHPVRPIVVTTMLTLDGVMEAPGGGDHPHAGWTFTDIEFDPAAYELKGREQEEATAMLLGRVSYQEFAPVWPSMTEEFPRYNAMPKHVVSSTLAEDDLVDGWGETTILRGLEDVAALRETEGGPILVHGSGTLARGLAAAGLVDRYHLLTFPVVLGSGARLFADDGPRTLLRPVETASYPNGITMGVWDVVR